MNINTNFCTFPKRSYQYVCIIPRKAPINSSSRSDVIQHGDTVIGTRFNPNLPLYKVLGSYLCRARLHSHRFARFFTFGLSQID